MTALSHRNRPLEDRPWGLDIAMVTLVACLIVAIGVLPMIPFLIAVVPVAAVMLVLDHQARRAEGREWGEMTRTGRTLGTLVGVVPALLIALSWGIGSSVRPVLPVGVIVGTAVLTGLLLLVTIRLEHEMLAVERGRATGAEVEAATD